MAFKHGSIATFKVGTPTATDITAYINSVGVARAADTAETTVLGNTSKAYLAGLKDGTISVEGYFDPTVNTLLSGLLGASALFEYCPQGGSSPKVSGSCICTAYEVSTAVDGAGTFSAEFQITGDVVVA